MYINRGRNTYRSSIPKPTKPRGKTVDVDKFSRETPMDKEWALWVSFWRNHCDPRLWLPQIVGKWVTVSHQIWPWYHDKAKDVIYHQTMTTFLAYVLLVRNRGKAGNLYVLLGETYTIPTRVVPVTTTQVEQDVVAL
jgi:hypothetical protein